MSVVERLAGRNSVATKSALDEQSLRQALKALRLAQRLLANGATDLAAPHLQLALDLIDPLAARAEVCAALPDALRICDVARELPRDGRVTQAEAALAAVRNALEAAELKVAA